MAAIPHSNFPTWCSKGNFSRINILGTVLHQGKPWEWSPLLQEVTMAMREKDSIAEEGAVEVAYNFGCLGLLSI